MRKQVKEALNQLGINNEFSLKTVYFSDLARGQAMFCKLKNWEPNPIFADAKRELSKIGVILQG